MSKVKRIVVTGGAGFIGSEVVNQLVSEGFDVTAVDNLTNGSESNLKDITSDQFELKTVDIRDTESMRSILTGADLVFHLACLGVRHSIHSPMENHEVNATATLELLRLARSLEVERFVYVSSSEVYGTAISVPQPETHPTLPMTVYGASKLAGECYTRAYHRTYDYPTTVVRPFNTYGPRCHHEGDSGEVIPKFLLRAMTNEPLIVFGDGEQTRDFTYVSDTAAGIIKIGFSDATIGETINLGYGEELSINTLAAEIKSICSGTQSSIVYENPRPGDVLRLYADMSKAQSLIGYQPKVSLGEGLKRLLQWYRDSGRDPVEMLKEESVFNWEQPKS
ncbi:SDR family NAD(P)-dependent oxidoreductase [Rubellicoccus peritrichatus]|uniref:SDR family NAD(P)-dependent oxidoreductase n=1 Tax=Rubellicoccus peritrichatus TaxID=3080537 RepID=A0AAQ3LCP3_9BACT|nr:SDR family NAD(P)-dependent oxidoreductase [Puniceicoccus sp. CR14]WOO42957.1 SDR family NAD(P)-dependent oxidoreductase [Puniceicoccus sp. CR14]